MSLQVANVAEHLKSRSTPTPSSSTIEPSVSGGESLSCFSPKLSPGRRLAGAPVLRASCNPPRLSFVDKLLDRFVLTILLRNHPEEI